MVDNLEYQTVVIAALLHDIGKFLQRGRSLDFNVTGTHPEVSARFISAFSDSFAQFSDPALLKLLVQYHHRGLGIGGFSAENVSDPRSRLLAFLINRADSLSASERGTHTEQWQDYKTTPLVSLFPNIFSTTPGIKSLKHHPFTLTLPAELTKTSLFPTAFDEYETGELEGTLRTFGAQASTLLRELNTGFYGTISHLLSILSTYVSAIPSDTQEEIPDISLFDHLKTTAAIASCLYLYHRENNLLEEDKLFKYKDVPFLLAVGDVSGIQDYIFKLSASGEGGISKRLRARSLFIQLISEVVPAVILRDFSLTSANLIMSSGGKFYIIIPNLPSSPDRLGNMRREVDDWFCNALRGSLSLNLAWVSFGETGFRDFGDVIRASGERLNYEKQNRFRSILTAGNKWEPNRFLMPSFPPSFTPCPSCRLFASKEGRDCDNCASDRSWGRKLRDTKYVAIYHDRTSGERELAGNSISLLQNTGDIADNPFQIIGINNPDTRALAKFPASSRYFVNYVPLRGIEALDFGEIAGKSSGRKYLAFLKADVDNLGKTFAFGLKGRDSISRLTTLSRQLDLFFTGWVEHLLEKDFADCYSVFSGGDDLFIVGPWNRILELSNTLRRDFGEYTGNNLRLTLSAGVVIAPSSYPISAAADDAEDAVEQSKQEEKDRITLLGHTLRWDDWWVIEKQWKLLKPEQTTSSLLYSLIEYGKMWQAWKEGDVLGLRFQPLLAYNISRNLDQRRCPEMYRWAKGLTDYKPGEKEKELILDNLGLIAQLLVLGKE